MNRQQLLHILVLNQIADTYDAFERVIDCVTQLGTRCGVALEQSEIASELNKLVDSGLARAYRLSPDWRRFETITGWPRPSEIESSYFLLTDKGISEVRELRSLWPLDEDDVPIKDWTLS